jgi:hypothetical protein
MAAAKKFQHNYQADVPAPNQIKVYFKAEIKGLRQDIEIFLKNAPEEWQEYGVTLLLLDATEGA